MSVGLGSLPTMSTFVLVPGAWLGAWAWDDLVPGLRAAGHATYPLSLSGLADKRDVPPETIGQQTHVADIVDLIERHDLRDVILAGHSYAGIPVGQAAERIGDRLARVVFLDANLPVDGASFASDWSEAGQAWLNDQLAEGGGYWPPREASDYAEQDLTDEQIERIVAGSTPHPGRPLLEPAVLARPLGELPATFLDCALSGETGDTVAGLLTSDSWELVTMETGHWPMFSQPKALTEILLSIAES